MTLNSVDFLFFLLTAALTAVLTAVLTAALTAVLTAAAELVVHFTQGATCLCSCIFLP